MGRELVESQNLNEVREIGDQGAMAGIEMEFKVTEIILGLRFLSCMELTTI